MNETEIFFDVLKNANVYPVYQPIVSLRNGQVLGYEALSRIGEPYTKMPIIRAFELAMETEKLWEFEKICRTRALQRAKGLPHGKRLFLNVAPETIHDEKFREGFTKKKIKKYELDENDIVFELTERTAIGDMETFKDMVKHYQLQGYRIAVDDVGSAYGSLNRVCGLFPDFIKIDYEMIHEIHKDSVKRAMVRNLVRFSNEAKLSVIAEGVESREELEILIRLGVSYGQGFYLGRPKEKMEDTSSDMKKEIQASYRYNKKRIQKNNVKELDRLEMKEFQLQSECAINLVESKLQIIGSELSMTLGRNVISAITSRTKSAESTRKKLERKGLPLNMENANAHINDLIGVRAVCAFEDDIARVAKIMLSHEDVKLVKKKDYVNHPKPSGYRSLHLIIQVPIYFTGGAKWMKVEVQIRTAAMNFWAELDHQLRYKGGKKETELIGAELYQYSKDIAEVDKRMVELRKKISAI